MSCRCKWRNGKWRLNKGNHKYSNFQVEIWCMTMWMSTLPLQHTHSMQCLSFAQHSGHNILISNVFANVWVHTHTEWVLVKRWPGSIAATTVFSSSFSRSWVIAMLLENWKLIWQKSTRCHLSTMTMDVGYGASKQTVHKFTMCEVHALWLPFFFITHESCAMCIVSFSLFMSMEKPYARHPSHPFTSYRKCASTQRCRSPSTSTTIFHFFFFFCSTFCVLTHTLLAPSQLFAHPFRFNLPRVTTITRIRRQRYRLIAISLSLSLSLPLS